VPELTKVPLEYEKPAPLVLVNAAAGPYRRFANEFADYVRCTPVDSLGDALFQSQLQGPVRISEFTGGRCACGRLSLMLSRCPRCAREEAALVNEVDESETEEVEIAAITARVPSPSGWVALGADWLPCPARLISSADVVRFATTGRVSSTWPGLALPASSLDMRATSVGSGPVHLFREIAGKLTESPSQFLMAPQR